jgi:L-lactate dehydrogenase complex protein LldE
VEVALFVPCHVDQLAPQVALAAAALLEHLGCRVRFDPAQTCCGQPFLNAGHFDLATDLARRHAEIFADERYVVAPSGSCVAMIRSHYASLLDSRAAELASRTFELCEFVHDVLGLRRLPGRFGHRVALHGACHGVRELRLATPSEECGEERFDKVAALLRGKEGVDLVTLEDADECCGFGGSFAVKQEAISCAMACDKLAAGARSGAEFMTATDASCLLHLESVARRQLPDAPRTIHVAEILAAGLR